MAQLASPAALRRAKRLISATRAFRAKVEKTQAPSFAADLGAYFTAQAGRLLLPDAKGRKALPKKLDPLTLLDWTAEDAFLLTIVEGHFTDVAQLALPFVGEQLGLTVAFDLANPYIARVLDGVGVLVKGLNADSQQMLQDAIESGLAAGDGPGVIAANLSDLVAGWSDARSLTIARTETAHAFNWAATAGYRDSGIVSDCICLDSPDCGWDGHDDPEQADGTVRSLDEAEEFPTSHPNAVFEGTTIEPLGGVLAGYRAWWNGPAVAISTTGGPHDTVGPNHPVLTERGWVRAKDLRQGDHVVRRTGHRGMAAGAEDLDDCPATAAQVFEALRATGKSRTGVVAPLDLHGDGNFCQGEVEVVWTDRPLTSVPHVALIEQDGEAVLEEGRHSHPYFSGPSSRLFALDRVDLAATGGVRSLDVDPVAVARADRDPGAVQPLSDRALADAEFLGELEARYALGVAGQEQPERVPRALASGSSGHARGGQTAQDGGGANAARLSHIGGAGAGGVVLDEILEVDLNVSWQGWAYDFETQGRAYFAGSYLKSNCVRAFAPNVDTGDGQLSDEVPADSPEAEAIAAGDEA